jgi:hypothetical protein
MTGTSHRALRAGLAGLALWTLAAGARAQQAPRGDSDATDGGTEAPSGAADTAPAAQTGTEASAEEQPEEASDGAGESDRGARAPAEDAAESREQPLTEEQRARMIPSEGELPDPRERAPRRFFLPPYLREWGPEHDTTVLFPLYFNSRVRDTSWLLIPPYFRLRSPTSATDALFPLFFRSTGTSPDGARHDTTIVPPVWVHRATGPERARTLAYGAFPLFSYLERFNREGRLEGEHLIIPPLLTVHRWTRTSQQTITPVFQYVREGSSTTWTAGPVIPLVARHASPTTRWTLAWPLMFFHRSNLVEDRHLTVVGPFWTERGPGSLSVNLAPLFFHSHTRTDSRTTLFPLFHTESSRAHFTLITPLGGYTRASGESTLVLPLYQNHRGVSQLDAVAPLFFYARNPRAGTSTVSVLNFVHSTRPTGYSWTFFPLIGRIHEEGRFDTTITPLFAHSYDEARRASTTWVFPNVHVERSPTHRVVNVYPLFFHAATREWHHNVLFPFVWDVGNRAERRQTTVIFPFYAHVGDRSGYTRWAFPDVFWWRHGSGETLSWGYDIAPFFQYAEPRRGDYSWTVLYGLAGHRRQGNYEQTRVFWATIDHRRPDGAPRPSARRVPTDRDVVLDL